MRVFFRAPHPVFGRANSRRPVSYQQRSPYYWWWAYLRRNKDYLACCESGGAGALASLYADFGDVRADEFHRWWTEGGRGVRLFGERPLEVKFGEIKSSADWLPTWAASDVLVVAVPLAVSKRRLKGEFARLLDERHTGKRGRPAVGQQASTARYSLRQNYTITSLRTTLQVYDTWLANQSLPPSQRLTQWQLGKPLNKQAARAAESTLAAERLLGRNVLAATVSRYVARAKRLIEGTAQGQFPVA
jgi:hypothetical protein